MHLYLGTNPRALYLVTSSHDQRLGRPRRALVFRAAPSTTAQVIVEFLHKDGVDFSNLTRLTTRIVKGCLGLIAVENGERCAACMCTRLIFRTLDIFMAVVTSASEIGNTRPSVSKQESVARIHEVYFYSLTSPTWDVLVPMESLPSPDIQETMVRESYAQIVPPPQVFEHPCMPLTKILSSGSFYYALEPPWDLSSRLGVRLSRHDNVSMDVGTFDERFVWNEYIVRGLLEFRDRLDPFEREDLDRCQFLVSAFFFQKKI